MILSSIPIRIHPFFWLFALLIGWLNSQEPAQIFVWVFVILVSILVHELGHATVGKLFGQKVRIELFAFGGMTYRMGPKLNLGKEFLVVLAGPFMGAILALISYYFLQHLGETKSLIYFGIHLLVIVNVLWTVLNLLPVMPLDGGQLMRIILEKLFKLKGIKASHTISFVLALLLTFGFFAIGQLFIGILFFILAIMGYRSLKEVRLMSEKDQDKELQKNFEVAEDKLMHGEKEEAMKEFAKIREKSHEGMIYNIATETSVLMMLEDQNLNTEKRKEAYRLLLELPQVSSELTPAFHHLAFENGDITKTLELADEAYQMRPSPETALINAMAFAHVHKVEAAVGWLENLLEYGDVKLKEILQRKEFDPIRQSDQFKEFEKIQEK